jgi:hypothetical protein
MTVVLTAVPIGAAAGPALATPGPASTVVVSLAPAHVAADGNSTTIATASVTDAKGNPVSGDDVSFASSDAGNAIGPVSEPDPGTYSATITSSMTVGMPTITATDKSDGVFGQATLDQQTPEPAAHVEVSVDPLSIVADGSSKATATAIVSDENGNRVPGDTVSFSSSDAGEVVGVTESEGNGVYAATITSSTKAQEVTIAATDSTPATPVSGHSEYPHNLIQTAGPASTVSVSLSPSSIVADGMSTSTATAMVTDAHGNPVTGDEVSFSTNDEGELLGGFRNNHDGTYSVTITSSTKVHAVTVTAIDFSVLPAVSNTATLTQTVGPASSIGVSLLPTSIVANGSSTTTATATVTDAEGHRVAGETVSFTGSDPNLHIGAVHDNGDGTYSASITSSTTVGTPTITATDTETGVFGQATLTQTAGPATDVSVELSPSSIVANGTSTATATATVTDADGHRVSGDSVEISSADAGSGIGPVTDRHDGTYTATITSSTTAHKVAITATDTSASPQPSGMAELTQTPGAAAHVVVSLLPSSIIANGSSTATATATVTDAHGNGVPGDTVSFSSSHAGNVIGPVTDKHDGTYTATVT